MKGKSEDELSRVVKRAYSGGPDIKRSEKVRFLGEFRERVLRTLTFDQIEEPGTYDEIRRSIEDPRAARLVISRKADLSSASEYIRLAHERGLRFTTVDSPQFEGDIGLVVSAEKAVEVAEPEVEPRAVRLRRKGLSEGLVAAEGRKLCSECYELIRERAPEELARYGRATLLDRLTGYSCPACSDSR